MKFIDLKTGETFAPATLRFCGEHIRNRCASCPMKKIQKTADCKTWVMQHPLEAAKLMGYGIVGEGGDEIKFAVPVNNPSLAGSGGKGGVGTGGGVKPEPRSKILIKIESEYTRQYEETCKVIEESLIAIRDVVRRHYMEKMDNALKEYLKMDEESK